LATDTQTHGLADAAPAAAVLVGTWAYATLVDDHNGRTETWSMLEATALSTTTGLVLKFAAGRERPSTTTDTNSWRAGGDAFPSLHTTAAFAIGTVLAESGNDEYRWVRRVVGYGLGVATSYQRIKHNQHWLSDTVAGAALGMSSAHFVLNRRDTRQTQTNITVIPTDGGVLLAYSVALH
jgi:membrane-associated phospholipid phosphatase